MRLRAATLLVLSSLVTVPAHAEERERDRGEKRERGQKPEPERGEKRDEEHARNKRFKTEEQETLYALGALLGRRAAPFKLTPAELKLVQQGFTDAATGKPLALGDDEELEEMGPKVDALGVKRSAPALAAEKQRAQAFLDAQAKEPGAVKLPSGVVVRTLQPGTGPQPAASDVVKVDYEGRLRDGTVFDAASQHGGPATFGLDKVIKCWGEGVQKMHVGEKARISCPSALAYGDQGRPPQIPGASALVFDVTLLAIEKK